MEMSTLNLQISDQTSIKMKANRSALRDFWNMAQKIHCYVIFQETSYYGCVVY